MILKLTFNKLSTGWSEARATKLKKIIKIKNLFLYNQNFYFTIEILVDIKFKLSNVFHTDLI